MSFFNFLRALAFIHAGVYSLLLIVWLVPGLSAAEAVFGWSHGILWIALTLLMVIALRTRSVQWWLVLLVGVLGPVVPFVGAAGFLKAKAPTASGSYAEI